MQPFGCIALSFLAARVTSLALNTTFDSNSVQSINLTVPSFQSLTRYHFRSMIDDAIYIVRENWPNAELIEINAYKDGHQIIESPDEVRSLNLQFFDPPRGCIYVDGYSPAPGRPLEWEWPAFHKHIVYPHGYSPRTVSWPSQWDLWDAYALTKTLSHGRLDGFRQVSYQTRLYRSPLGWKEVFRFRAPSNRQRYIRWTLRTDTGTLIDSLRHGEPFDLGGDATAMPLQLGNRTDLGENNLS